MSELRLLGKSVQIRFTQDGAQLKTLTAIKDFSFQPSQKILTEGYLGETANRQDEIFEEVSGSFTVHPEDSEALVLQKAIADRSTRRQKDDTKVACTFRISFPNGQIARITIPDMKFDPIPFTVGARDSYVDMKFSFKSTTYLLSV